MRVVEAHAEFLPTETSSPCGFLHSRRDNLGRAISLMVLSACADGSAPSAPPALVAAGAVASADALQLTPALTRDDASDAIADAAQRLTGALEREVIAAGEVRALRAALEKLSAAIAQARGPLRPLLENVDRALTALESEDVSVGADLDAICLALRSARPSPPDLCPSSTTRQRRIRPCSSCTPARDSRSSC